MQIFFLVAGFFGAMLFFERSPIMMLKNRISRVVLPFIVFVLLLWPTIMFGFAYTNYIFDGVPNALGETQKAFTPNGAFVPKGTFHLWFLYYLSLITFTSVGLGLVFNRLPVVTSSITKAFEWIIQKPMIRIFVFGALSAGVYMIMGTWSVATSTSWMPDFNTFIYYMTFYLVGWVLFKSKHLLGEIMKYDWLCTLFGIGLFSIHFFMKDSFDYYEHIILKSVMVWLLIFGITGLFLRYASNHSQVMRYVSDSSYWVYLVHLTLTAIIPSMIVDWPIPSTLKFLTVLTVTGVFCFATYHYFVRATFIGQFLNGRKYSRKIKDIQSVEQVKKAA